MMQLPCGVWRDWLAPFQRIDKISELYEAGQEQAAVTLIDSLDLETRIESGDRRATISKVLIPLAQESAKIEEYAAAERYWRWAAVQFPERASYHFELTHNLLRQGKYEEALSSMLMAAELRPESTTYQLYLARQEAMKAALQAQRIDPDNPSAKNLLQRLGR